MSNYEHQISEFLFEFKNRFMQMQPFMGMPGKLGYYTKINRQDVNSALQVFIPNNFPIDAPILKVVPKFNNELIDQNGIVMDDSIRLWNINSSLKNCVNEILGKLEGRIPIKKQGNFAQNPQQGIMMGGVEDSNLTKDIISDLNKKSIEELIYINFNPEHYVAEFTKESRNANTILLNQIKELSQQYEMKKQQYDNVKSKIEMCKNQYEQKENELRNLYNQKQCIDSQLTVDKLISEMQKYIEENYNKPKQQLISNFMAKKITFDEFQNQFKDINLKFHYYSIIRDKLNQCK